MYLPFPALAVNPHAVVDDEYPSLVHFFVSKLEHYAFALCFAAVATIRV